MRVTTLAQAKGKKVSRSREHMRWQSGPGVAAFDVDIQAGHEEIEIDELWYPITPRSIDALLRAVVPWWAGVDRLYRYSPLSGIATETGRVLKPLKNFRIFITIDDMTKTEALGAEAHAALHEAGHGWIELAANGNMLDRTLIDPCMYRPEHLIYVNPSLGEGLTRVECESLLIRGEHDRLETAGKGLGCTVAEWRRSSPAYKDLVAAKLPEQRAFVGRLKEQARAKAKEKGEPESEAASRVEQLAGHWLHLDFEICLESGDVVTCRELQENPKKYDGKRCYEPTDWSYRDEDPRIGLIYLTNGIPQVYSHAHGGTQYFMQALPVPASAFNEFPPRTEDEKAESAVFAQARAAVAMGGGPIAEAKRTPARKKRAPRVVGGETIIFRETNSKGEPLISSIENVREALGYLKVHLRLNSFTGRGEIEWLPGVSILDKTGILALWGGIQRLGLLVSRSFAEQAAEQIAYEDRFHPVRDWLEGLTWDGTPRLCGLFAKYAGAPDTEYNRTLSVLLLVALVRRVKEPGCKFDHVILFRGNQGTGKSTFFHELVGGPEYFTDNFDFRLASKEVIEQTSGKWLIEAGEMKGMPQADIDHVRSLITRRVDRARLAFDPGVSNDYPRQFVVVGTANDKVILTDQAGNRRFDLVDTGAIDFDGVTRDREQLFAEACVVERTYGPLILPEAVWAAAEAMQEAALVRDPVAEELEDIFNVEGRHGFISKDAIRERLNIRDSLQHWSSLKVARTIKETAQRFGWAEVRVKEEGRPRGFARKGANGEGAEDTPRGEKWVKVDIKVLNFTDEVEI